MSRAIERGNKRLLNVAKALRESPNPDKFTMDDWAQTCETPACALGHYAVRRDLQRVFVLRPWWGIVVVGLKKDPERRLFTHSMAIADHFAISQTQCEELFGMVGCGRAKTAVAAAEYVENFVKERL